MINKIISCLFHLGKIDLETKLTVLTLISQHLQMVLWFLSNNLLPETAGHYIISYLLKSKFLGIWHIFSHTQWVSVTLVIVSNWLDFIFGGKFQCILSKNMWQPTLFL